jgi:DNA replication protein DnaC
VSTTSSPVCAVRGCDRRATDWAPVWRTGWDSVADKPGRGGWYDTPYCDDHYPPAWERAIAKRIADLLAPFPRLASYSFATFPAADPAGAAAKANAEAWVDDFFERDNPRNLLIHSGGTARTHRGVGAGKTSLAVSCLRAVVERDTWTEARLINVNLLLAQIRLSFSHNGTGDPTDDLVRAELLLLDDLGAERPTDWAAETLTAIIEARYLAERTTIVTSNYAPSALAERLGDDDPVVGLRIVSRLTEDAVLIHLDRPDLRTRPRA